MRESAAGRALVLKPLFGSQGKDLLRVGCVDGEHVPLPALAAPYGGLAYLQRYVPPIVQPGFDWRVLVIGGRAVAAMRRISPEARPLGSQTSHRARAANRRR